MKRMFIEARFRKSVSVSRHIKKIPERIGVIAAVQFIDSVKKVKQEIDATGKKAVLGRGTNAVYKGQVLGCDIRAATSISDKVDAFVFIGTGSFHPKLIAFETGKDVFCLNPHSNKISKVKKKDFEAFERIKKASLVKFLSSKEIGVIVSMKEGQQNLKKAMSLKQRFKDKNFYIILFETVDFSQLENFPFIECFVNTACPRIALDDSISIRKRIINIDEIWEYEST